jgi:hypothetical protein
MYPTEVVWWSFTVWVLAVAVFMLVFARKVSQKGD